MFIFAHVFLGALIGLGFWYLTHDRWTLLLGILGAILPDLLDKPLALPVPGIFGSGRTIGHSLLFFAAALAIALVIWHCRHTLAAVACACAILSHQILDSMWTIPSVWFYPFLGPFTGFIIPDYIGHFFWLEIASPSELVFATASVLIGVYFLILPKPRITYRIAGGLHAIRSIAVFLLGVMCIDLLASGLMIIPRAFSAPTYDPVTCVMAGILALCGAIVLVKWPGPDLQLAD